MRRQPSRGAYVLAAVLVLFYGVRAVTGIVGGIAYARGSEAAGNGEFKTARDNLMWAVSPQDPAALFWLRGQVLEGMSELIFEDSGRTARGDELLVDAHKEYTSAVAVSPVSGWYWSDLGRVYQSQELMERAEQPMSLGSIDVDPWARVGRPGRIAIGLCRKGIAREPNAYGLHDRLAMTLIESGLDDLALEAVRDSARIQPIYYLHPYRDLPSPPVGLLDAFAEGSRSALGQTPLMARSVHLTALGRVEILRGNFVQAESDLRAALAQPGHRLGRAEASYHLGYALLQQGRYAEAKRYLEQSREHPNMEVRALGMLLNLAERVGDVDEAFRIAGLLRRTEPRNLAHVVTYSRVARRLEKWEQAEDALKWGEITHPNAARPRRELIDLYLETGDIVSARRVLADLARISGDSAEVRRLQKRVRQASVGDP